MNLLNGTQVTSINKRYQVYTVCPKGELDFYLVHKTLLTHTHTQTRTHAHKHINIHEIGRTCLELKNHGVPSSHGPINMEDSPAYHTSAIIKP